MNSVHRPLLIVGCGGHGRVLADIAARLGRPVTGFLDDYPDSAPSHLHVLGPIGRQIREFIETNSFVVGIGDALARREISELILQAGGELTCLVHPTSTISTDVNIGIGSVVMAGALINTGVRIGRYAVINTGAIIDHDVCIGDNVQISPGATLAGGVQCHDDAFVGIGASIIPRICVGSGAYVAAGAVVVRDVEPFTLVAGCPATWRKDLDRTN